MCFVGVKFSQKHSSTYMYTVMHVQSCSNVCCLQSCSNVCCLQDVGASITEALYDVARPENMSPAFINTDDAPPPGYDVVCKEHMQSPEYETVPLALTGKRTLTSENPPPLPPPLPPPMIRGDSEAPDLPPPYNPAVDNESVIDLLVESIQCVENESVVDLVVESSIAGVWRTSQ